MMGLSRDTFYRYKSAVDEGRVNALLDQTRRKPNINFLCYSGLKIFLISLVINLENSLCAVSSK